MLLFSPPEQRTARRMSAMIFQNQHRLFKFVIKFQPIIWLDSFSHFEIINAHFLYFLLLLVVVVSIGACSLSHLIWISDRHYTYSLWCSFKSSTLHIKARAVSSHNCVYFFHEEKKWCKIFYHRIFVSRVWTHTHTHFWAIVLFCMPCLLVTSFSLNMHFSA